MQTENYFIEYRYIPGSLWERDMASAKASGDEKEISELFAAGSGGYGPHNNGAIVREAFRYRISAEKRLAELNANPCIQWASPCGRLAASPASSYGYNPGETRLPDAP